MIDIREVVPADNDQIWAIIQPVISAGDTYVFDPKSSKAQMLTYWCGPDKHTYVASIDGNVVGTFILKDNQPGLGAHIANGSYMTLGTASGQGVGRAMGEFSLVEAKRLGYKAMQFNCVVKSNERAVRLWQKLGFTIIGEVPDAFNHKQNGLTNAYIMYRKL
ncbi:GNAT family N-acetyltransferase [Spirosoma agri]|uniref:GNAT family N-acetyltransferase n=1 Tax=Spirosoma agri TaxID=1987381 RepID=A0A6M0IF09_9BACT|nr:N-acetyltransferase [Spirosoma agri]NEU66382.1 GNAT family N-acetyltransferase [Spirosoma agri]